MANETADELIMQAMREDHASIVTTNEHARASHRKMAEELRARARALRRESSVEF